MIEAPVNGGRNYNGPKVAKLCGKLQKLPGTGPRLGELSVKIRKTSARPSETLRSGSKLDANFVGEGCFHVGINPNESMTAGFQFFLNSLVVSADPTR